MKIEQGFEADQEPNEFENLNNLFRKNFNIEKTIKLAKDVDRNNNPTELPKQKIFWTELKNPETNETVECKVYFPKNGNVGKVLIIEPGYRGDFVLQESEYANDFANNERALIVLRHNGLRIQGEDVKNYVHCPDKQFYGSKKDQRYLGTREFGILESNKEVLIALKSMGHAVENLKKIDIIGHSLGAHAAIRSIIELERETKENKVSEEISKKIDNLVIMGAWLETRKEVLADYLDFFQSEEGGDYFKNLSGEKIIRELEESANEIKKVKASDFPENMRIVGINSVADGEIDLEGQFFNFFNQIKDLKRKGSIVTKDLKEMLTENIGGRESETHDYALALIRKWIKLVIH